jgi:hypothetical protein
MTSFHSGLSLLSDAQLEAVRGGMFGPFVNKPFKPADFAPKPPPPPQPPVTQGLGKAMAKGAVLGGLTGAATGNTAVGLAGGALVGGMDHCMDRLPPIGPSPVPTNLDIVSQVHPFAYSQVREM